MLVLLPITQAALVKEWTPSTAEKDAALVLASFFVRHHISDELKLWKKSIKKEYPAIPFIPSDFSVFGCSYSNYVRSCQGFKLYAVDSCVYEFIVVQHRLPDSLRERFPASRDFTVYVEMNIGHVGLGLGNIPVFFSEGPPFMLGRHRRGSSVSKYQEKCIFRQD